MILLRLSESEVFTVTNALRAAAERFNRNAETTRDQTGDDRAAALFDRQAQEASALAERIDERKGRQEITETTAKVWLKTPTGEDILIDPAGVTHVTPSGLPGCSMIHPLLNLVLGDCRDVATALWPDDYKVVRAIK